MITLTAEEFGWMIGLIIGFFGAFSLIVLAKYLMGE